MQKRFLLALSMLTVGVLSTIVSCGTENADSGEPVSIPQVVINCQSGNCRTNVTAAKVIALYTQSGCTNPNFGGAVTGSVQNIACTSTGGCYGTISSWVDEQGQTVTTLPSGTYSVCAYIDYYNAYPNNSTYAVGVLDGVTASGGGSRFVTSWTNYTGSL